MTWTAPPAEYATNLLTGTEREQLESWLDTHRRTLLWKCEGLTEQQLKTPASPPSSLTLLGVVRHLADCERWWFQKIAAGHDVPDLYGTTGDFPPHAPD